MQSDEGFSGKMSEELLQIIPIAEQMNILALSQIFAAEPISRT